MQGGVKLGLHIEQTYGRIGLRRTDSVLDISSRSTGTEIRQHFARVKIASERPQIQIDQYEAFADAGLKNSLDLARTEAYHAYSQVMKYIGKVAQDGDRLAAIEEGGEPACEIALRDAYPEKHFELDFIPKSRPEITVKGGSLKIEDDSNPAGTYNGVSIAPGKKQLDISYRPAEISVYMERYAAVRFEYRNNDVDIRL